MPRRRINRSARELQEAAADIAAWFKWDLESISDFHEYAQRFGGQPGGNVREMVLRDALAYRGTTLERFRSSVRTR